MENLNNKTIVVTGANGLIGENLVLNLINRKSKIIAIDKSFKEKEVANMFQEKYRYKDILLYSTDILD